MSEYQNRPVEINSLPQIVAVDFTPLDKNYVILSLIETAVFWCFVWIPFIIFNWFIQKFSIPIWVGPLILFLTLFSCLHSFLDAKARGYRLRERDILYKRGVWWKSRTGVSFKRIQHIDISHGPIERKLGMASIKFFTAGGSSADLRISGLPKEYAEQLRVHILEKTGISDD